MAGGRRAIALPPGSTYVVSYVTPLPDLFAVSCVGDRLVAISLAPDGRGFDRRELLPCKRLHGGDEGAKPPVINRDRERRALRAVRSAQ